MCFDCVSTWIDALLSLDLAGSPPYFLYTYNPRTVLTNKRNFILNFISFLSSTLSIGMDILPPKFEISQGLVVIDPTQRQVHLHPQDVVMSHTINLPQSSRLIQMLKVHAETILQVGLGQVLV